MLSYYILEFIAGLGRGFTFSGLSAFTIKSVKTDQGATATGFFQAACAVGIFLGSIITSFFIEVAVISRLTPSLYDLKLLKLNRISIFTPF